MTTFIVSLLVYTLKRTTSKCHLYWAMCALPVPTTEYVLHSVPLPRFMQTPTVLSMIKSLPNVYGEICTSTVKRKHFILASIKTVYNCYYHNVVEILYEQ